MKNQWLANRYKINFKVTRWFTRYLIIIPIGSLSLFATQHDYSDLISISSDVTGKNAFMYNFLPCFKQIGSLLHEWILHVSVTSRIWRLRISDVMINAMASQITGVYIVNIIVCSGADQRRHQSSMSLVFVRGIHRWPGNSPHNGPVTRKIYLMTSSC